MADIPHWVLDAAWHQEQHHHHALCGLNSLSPCLPGKTFVLQVSMQPSSERKHFFLTLFHGRTCSLSSCR